MAVFATHLFLCIYISFLKSVSFSLQFPLSSFCFIISSSFFLSFTFFPQSGLDTFLLEFVCWKINGTNSAVRVSLLSVISPRHAVLHVQVNSLFLAYGSQNRPFEIVAAWSFPLGPKGTSCGQARSAYWGASFQHVCKEGRNSGKNVLMSSQCLLNFSLLTKKMPFGKKRLCK